MKTKSITTLSILLTVSMLSMACGLMSLPAAESPTSPAPVVETLPTQAAPQPEMATQPQTQSEPSSLSYPIVDTDQAFCYDDLSSGACPNEGEAYFGQDAQYVGNAPRYQDNGDGTVFDLVTGLMWQQDPGEKMTYDQAVAGASGFNLAGYSDWRLPSIKELYSLIQFDGLDPSGPNNSTLVPFIDTDYFAFEYGDESAGERIIDSQWATSSVYTGTVFGGQQAMFGVNFADGRIKGYPTGSGRGPSKTYFVIYVRGNTSYGINNFSDNGNGTVTDHATGLTWTQNDSGAGMNWSSALNYCEGLDYAGVSDWRLPNAKELQSIVDYSRSPDATNSAAIDPVFNVSTITNEAGRTDYPFFWSSTTHADQVSGGNAAYVAFGRALGYMNSQWMDVHGAGAQRSDPKTGSASDYPTGHGPQGDAMRVDNYVRCVTGEFNGAAQTGSIIETMPETQPAQVPAEQSPQQSGPQNRQPPQEALDACVSQSQGAACTVDTPNGTITGSCAVVQSGQLACVPAGGLPPQ